MAAHYLLTHATKPRGQHPSPLWTLVLNLGARRTSRRRPRPGRKWRVKRRASNGPCLGSWGRGLGQRRTPVRRASSPWAMWTNGDGA